MYLCVEVYGILDELNVMLSLCVCVVVEEEQCILFEVLQQYIFWFSVEFVSDSEQLLLGKCYISSEEIVLLEQIIDCEMVCVLVLYQFVLFGCCEVVSCLYLVCIVVRWVECWLVELGVEVIICQMLLCYLNCLFDCLYVLVCSEDYVVYQCCFVMEIVVCYLVVSGLFVFDVFKVQVGLFFFYELYQFICQVIEYVCQLQVLVVVSIVDVYGIEIVIW